MSGAEQHDGQPTVEHDALAPEAAAADAIAREALAPEPGPVDGIAPAPADGATPAAIPPSAFPSAAPSTVDQRPELLVGGAFAGGLVLAILLKRLAR